MLPVPALVVPSGAWLGDTSQISILPAWWSLHPAAALATSSVTSTMHMVVISGFGELKRAGPSDGYSEATEVARLFPRSTLIDGDSATPQSVLRSLASAELFHFSGHATADSGTQLLLNSATEEWRPSAFRHSLTPQSIVSAHLLGCRIAVLAACNTTAADPDQIEKLPDLRNALLLSGVHSVVASDWDVDDHSTRSLMLAFYRQLVIGNSATRSLQFAQLSVRSANRWRHPYFWASFEVFTN
jgi:CHAT domain-containing protein